MRFVALFLSLCMTMNVFASSAGPFQLEREFDEFNYVLSVEWDQRDQSFYEAESLKFLQKITQIMRDQGLTPDDLLALAEKRVKNKAELEAFKLRLALRAQGSSEADLMEIIKETSSEFYSKGANWNGEGVIFFGGTFLFIGLVVALALLYSSEMEKKREQDQAEFARTYVCTAEEQRYECESESRPNSLGTLVTNTVCGYKSVCVAGYFKK